MISLNMRKLRWNAFVLIFGTWLTSGVAGAQQARSFEQLQMLVRQDDRITVTETAGPVSVGRVVEITDSSLQIATANSVREFTERDVFRITDRRPDSVGNGAKYGGIVGAILGVIGGIAFAVDDYEDCTGCVVAAVPVYTALGIGTGVAIDAMIVRERTIFTGVATSSRVSAKPVFSSSHRSISINVSW
jgi:hypothetical protein